MRVLDLAVHCYPRRKQGKLPCRGMMFIFKDVIIHIRMMPQGNGKHGGLEV